MPNKSSFGNSQIHQYVYSKIYHKGWEIYFSNVKGTCTFGNVFSLNVLAQPKGTTDFWHFIIKADSFASKNKHFHLIGLNELGFGNPIF